MIFRQIESVFCFGNIKMPALENTFALAKPPAKAESVNKTVAPESENQSDTPFKQQLKDEIDKTELQQATAETAQSSDTETSESSDEFGVSVEPVVSALLETESLEEADGLVTGKELPVAAVINPLLPKSESDIADNRTVIASAKNVSVPVAVTSASVTTDFTGADSESELSSDFLQENAEFAELAATKTKKQYLDGQPAVKTETVLMDMTKTSKVIQLSPANTMVTNDLNKSSADQLPQQLQMTTPVNQKQWGSELSKRITMLINNGQQQVAELRLNPAHLGPLSVRLQLDDDQANISFVTNHQAVKEAIELSLPKLKDQLQQQGLDLGNVDVGTQDSGNEDTENHLTDSKNSVFDDVDSTESNLQSIVETDIIDSGVSIFV